TVFRRRQPRDRLRRLEPVRVDVVQRDLDVLQFREPEEVRKQLARELDAACADEGDPGHPFFAPSVRPLTNCFCRSTKTSTVGRAMRTEAAEIRFVSVKKVPCRLVIEEVIGRLSPVLMSTCAQRKSLWRN